MRWKDRLCERGWDIREEDHEHGGPFEVFEEGAEEGLFAEAVAEDRETDGAHEVENYDDGDKDY